MDNYGTGTLPFLFGFQYLANTNGTLFKNAPLDLIRKFAMSHVSRMVKKGF